MKNSIRQFRLEKGMTQEELAEKACISRATLSGLESGRVTVTTTKTLARIAKALGESIDSIFFADKV